MTQARRPDIRAARGVEMLHIRIAAALIGLGMAVPAAAQCGCSSGSTSDFGDTRLSYSNGVVYDDDLVPGRGPNQPYLVDEQAGGGGGATYDDYGYTRSPSQAYVAAGRGRIDSPNLIGRGGRAIGY